MKTAWWIALLTVAVFHRVDPSFCISNSVGAQHASSNQRVLKNDVTLLQQIKWTQKLANVNPILYKASLALKIKTDYDVNANTDGGNNGGNSLLIFALTGSLVAVTLGFWIYLLRLKKHHREKEATAHAELKVIKAQLMQQEKLASLGQLTAGIAHEIKNPLNFVNNFAQLSGDLINDFYTAVDEAEREDILKDLKSNLVKINQHGQRADRIVQSMLQHSRGAKGEKQPTDLNKLCDEFADLAFHGMRATNPGFNCKIEKR